MNRKMRNIILYGTCAMFSAAMLAGCSTALDTVETVTQSATEQVQITAEQSSGDYSDVDLDSSYDAETSADIVLDGDSIQTNADGVSVDGSTATITAAGTYILSGLLNDGQINVDAGDSDEVQLVLNGVDITCQTNAPINVLNADKVIITLADSTQNIVTDGDSYVYEDSATDEPNAAIFSKDDLTINGTGSLTVNANYNNGITSKDDLVVVEGTIVVTAVNDALRGRDSVTVQNGAFTLTAGGDGIQSNNDEDAEQGYIVIDGGSFTINAANDGIQAETSLVINSGTFDITTGGGSANAEQRVSQDFGGPMQQQNIDTTETSEEDEASDSSKGIKSGTLVTVTGGEFNMDCADDSIHSNGDIVLSGGDFTIATGDDGLHADNTATVNAGSINITNSFEGIEGSIVNIEGGDINIIASDDGINAAGGTDGDNGLFGQDSFSGNGSLSYSINISGGNVDMVAGDDGFDSNGDINISAGDIVSLINSSNDNGALDYDGTLTVTGGNICYGGTGTGMGPSDNSTQSYVYVSGSITKGTEVTVQQNGQIIASFTLSIDCSSLAISTPDIVNGQSYDIYGGDTLISTAAAGSGSGNMPGDGGMGGR